MSGVKYWMSKGSYSMINRFVIFFFGFASYFVLVRYFDKTDFGIYTLYMVIITFVETARTAFIQNGFVRYYVREQSEQDKQEVLTSSIQLNIIISLSTASIIYIGSYWIGKIYGSNELTTMIQVFCIMSPFLIIYSQVGYYLNATINFKAIALISLIRYGSFFICTVGMFFYESKFTLVEVIYCYAGSIFLGAMVSFFYASKSHFKLTKTNWKLFNELFSFGKYTFGTGLTSLLTRSVDQLMIGYYIGSEAVATYNVAGRFLSLIEIPITSISQVTYPKFAATVNSSHQKNDLARLYERSTGLILAVIFPMVLLIFIFPSLLIRLVAGDNYLDAAPILQMFIIMNLLKPLGTQSGSVLEALGKPKVIFYGLLSSTILNIVLNYFLIRMDGWYGGIIGAAIASMISGIFFLIIATLVTAKECNYSWGNLFREVLKTYKMLISLGLEYIKKKK
jgi:lipopolysaccharide exporter